MGTRVSVFFIIFVFFSNRRSRLDESLENEVREGFGRGPGGLRWPVGGTPGATWGLRRALRGAIWDLGAPKCSSGTPLWVSGEAKVLVRGLISAPRGVPVGTLANRLGNVWMEKSEEKCGRKNLEEKRSVEGNYRREMWKVESEEIFGVGDQKRNSEERSGREIRKRGSEAKLGLRFRRRNSKEKSGSEARKNLSESERGREVRTRNSEELRAGPWVQGGTMQVARPEANGGAWCLSPKRHGLRQATCGARGAPWPVDKR